MPLGPIHTAQVREASSACFERLLPRLTGHEMPLVQPGGEVGFVLQPVGQDFHGWLIAAAVRKKDIEHRTIGHDIPPEPAKLHPSVHTAPAPLRGPSR